jgi:predicted HicB family RNase H-like nuclease
MHKRIGRKRLSVDIPIRLHESLTIVAKSRNITLTKYIIRALIRYSLNETKYEDTLELFKEFK